MKFDVVIIGGGLSGLACGIKLAENGKKVCIVSDGQSSLHFNPGSFELLGCDASGHAVAHPLEAIQSLDASHHYHKVSDVASTAAEAKQLLTDAGIAVTGDASANHFRLTPLGTLKPAWLTLSGIFTAETEQQFTGTKVKVINIIGYLDFPTKFVAAGLRKLGVDVTVKAITTPSLDKARRSASEMRSANLAKVLNDDTEIDLLAQEINGVASAADTVLLPAILGLADAASASALQERVAAKLQFAATLPPLVPGVRVQNMLRKRFQSLGGTVLTGDKAISGTFEGYKLTSITTAKLTDETIMAHDFVLATGSFMSHGLESNYQGVYEPIFGLDVDAAQDRTGWTAENVFAAQPYMEFGVATDSELHAKKDGHSLTNVYAAGSVLSGHNHLKLADGTGVDLLTALQVSNNILNQKGA